MNRMNCAILYEKHKNSSAKRIETVVFRRFFPILQRHIRIFFDRIFALGKHLLFSDRKVWRVLPPARGFYWFSLCAT